MTLIGERVKVTFKDDRKASQIGVLSDFENPGIVTLEKDSGEEMWINWATVRLIEEMEPIPKDPPEGEPDIPIEELMKHKDNGQY